jgi:uncharacterized protein (DUF1697 family)
MNTYLVLMHGINVGGRNAVSDYALAESVD